MNRISSLACISDKVKIGNNVIIEPFAIIDGDVIIGDNTYIGPYVRITGKTEIGENTKIYDGAVIGTPPQDYSYNGEEGLIKIGKGCIIREHVTIHTPVNGSSGGITLIEDEVFLMVNSHIAHNAKVGRKSVLANGALLAGYVEVENNVFISGNVGVHQFCRIGAYSIVGTLSRINQDVPPYSLVDGNPACYHSINSVGLKRNGFSQKDRTDIKNIYKILYSIHNRKEAIEKINEKFPDNIYKDKIINFIENSKRGIVSYAGRSEEE